MAQKAIEFVSPNGSKLTAREQRVIQYIDDHGSITAAEAEKTLHNHRLASTIEILRNKKGYNIDTVRVSTTNAFGEHTWFGRYVYSHD